MIEACPRRCFRWKAWVTHPLVPSPVQEQELAPLLRIDVDDALVELRDVEAERADSRDRCDSDEQEEE